MMTERSTGGATPLHMCGMSRHGQYSTRLIIRHDGEVEAFDTYGFTPLHRMCQNNLAVGAKELLEAGAMVTRKTKEGPTAGKTPMQIAKDVKAFKVIRVLRYYIKLDHEHDGSDSDTSSEGGSDTEMQDVPAELAGVPELAAANHGALGGQSMADIAEIMMRRVPDEKLRSTT
eukprot:FR744106.1.p1 GENE.FR744106.1~~FR744106.1.p1  ORF type:complete len:173 (+),score=14.28 FR744106.1:2-520(+)